MQFACEEAYCYLTATSVYAVILRLFFWRQFCLNIVKEDCIFLYMPVCKCIKCVFLENNKNSYASVGVHMHIRRGVPAFKPLPFFAPS